MPSVPVANKPNSTAGVWGGTPVFVLSNNVAEITGALQSTGRVLLGIGGTAAPETNPAILSGQVARSVNAVLQETTVAQLMIEGGTTAAGILHDRGWTRLRAINEIEGIAVLQPRGAGRTLLLIKPGSHPWPQKLWAGGLI